MTVNKLRIGPACVLALALCSPMRAEDDMDDSEIHVKATRAETALKDLGFSASVVTSEDIRELDADNVADAMRELTGLRVSRYGAAGSLSEISIRGSSSAQVLVLVDGRRINKTSDGSVDLSIYDTSDIERIEIIRGPASQLHGANAMAGAVNIVTKRIGEEPSTRLSAEAGTFNTQQYSLSTSRKMGNVGVRVSAGAVSSDGDRENSASDGYHITTKIEHDGEDSSTTLSAGYARLDAELPGSTKYPTPGSTQDDRRAWADLTYEYRITEALAILAKVFANDNTLEFYDPNLGDDDDLDSDQLGADLQATLQAGDKNKIVAGLYFERGEVDVRDKNGVSRIDGKQSLENYAIFAQDEIRLSDILTVTPAVRFDDYDLDSQFSPKVSARYYASDSTSLKCSYGEGFRPPTVNDLYWQSPYAVGNMDLKAETSLGWDAGVEQSLGENSLLSLSYFSMTVDDLVVWEARESDGLWSPFNIAEAEMRGIEVEISSQLSSDLRLSVAYTWMKTEDKGDFSGNELQYKPEHRASCRLSYRADSGFSASAALAYTDSVYTDQENTETLDSYTLLDIRIAQKIRETTELFVSGKNLLDEEYSIVSGYPLPGATVNAGVELVF